MKKLYTTLLICFLLNSMLYSQELSWVKTIGNTGSETAVSIITDASGNVYTTGYFSGTVDFDASSSIVNLVSNGGPSADIFILKNDSNGNFIWAKQIGGNDNDYASSITIGSDGFIFLTGTFRNTADFDPNAGISNFTSNGNEDVFIAKFDADGNLIWNRQVGGTSTDNSSCIKTSNIGEVYVSGYFNNTVDFDPNSSSIILTSNGLFDLFILKLNSSGNYVWAKQIGGTNNDYAYSLTIDSGNVYTTGSYYGTVDFNPGSAVENLGSGFNANVFVSKLDIDGNYVWAKSFGGTSVDIGFSIAIDISGNIYTAGSFQGFGVDFDPNAGTTTLNADGGADIFISKLSSSGNLIWAKRIGSFGYDVAYSICLDAQNNVYTTGQFDQYNVDFDPGTGTNFLTATDVNNNFISRLDTNGNFVWARNTPGRAVGDTVFVDANNNVFSIGTFQNTVDFDINAGLNNIISAGSTDFYIHKMNQQNLSNSSFENQIETIDFFPNPTSSLLNIQTNQAIKTITISDILGRQTVITNFNNSQIDVSNLSNGIYILQITTDLGLFKEKFIKQ